MDKRQGLTDIIVTLDNVVPVVQQHEECLPHIKEKIDHLTKRIDTLYRMEWVIILLIVAVIGEVENKVALSTYDGDGQVTVQDKAFLLSRVEVGLGSEGVTTGESVYEFYDGVTDAERIKLLSGSPRYWWLRSPSVGYTSNTRLVSTSGTLSDIYAYLTYGLSPACVIW